jgi:quercetin dioxygenase-like cupin family protein
VNAPGIRRILNGTTRPGAAERASQHGARLRALRTERHLSLREASRRAGVSVSFLSALERDLAGASVTTVQRLTHAYGVTVQDLLRPAGASDRRVPAGEGAVLEMEQAGVRIEQLAVGAKRLEPQLFVLAPASSSDGAYRHEGEEFLYVLEGSLTVWVGAEQPYRLATGDSLTFPSTQPHRWRNRADGETRLLWINTPPTF